MRVLILGAGGMLGHDLVASKPPDVELVSARSGRVDLTQDESVRRALDETEPRCVVNAAGYTAVDRAEDEPDVAMAVNGTGVAQLATACADRAISLVHFSSDYVFSGRSERAYREADVAEPASAYGRSKLAGEQGIARSGARALIIRTQWLFGAHGRSFPQTMLERARAGVPTRVVDDQMGRPTYTLDLSTWSWQLIRRGELGTVHAANGGSGTWFNVAQRVFERAGVTELLSRCATADYPTRATRPAFSILDIAKLVSLIGAPRPWTEALDEFLDQRLATV